MSGSGDDAPMSPGREERCAADEARKAGESTVPEALVLSALRVSEAGEAAAGVVEQVLIGRGYDVRTVDCLRLDVIPCTGCGSCGMRTPGACVVKDDMQDIFRKMVASDLLVLATPVRFGTYCAELKKVVDRFQPLMAPLYVLRDGEMHFQSRYDLPPLIGVGLLRENGEGERRREAAAEAEAFRFLVGRLAVNIDTRHAAAVIAGGDGAAARTELERAVDAVAERVR
jgi:hypothetical protein